LLSCFQCVRRCPKQVGCWFWGEKSSWGFGSIYEDKSDNISEIHSTICNISSLKDSATVKGDPPPELKSTVSVLVQDTLFWFWCALSDGTQSIDLPKSQLITIVLAKILSLSSGILQQSNINKWQGDAFLFLYFLIFQFCSKYKNSFLIGILVGNSFESRLIHLDSHIIMGSIAKLPSLVCCRSQRTNYKENV
jgi:hypothetical protein